MKKNILNVIIIFSVLFIADKTAAQIGEKGFKTTLDMTMNESGTVICEVTNKYTAAFWDNWTKMVGTNTSIINNGLRKLFPKYHLTDFKHSQDANERTNTVKFKIDGMMNVNKSGKWEAELDQKDPNITKVSGTEWLLVEGGETLKIHLPSGTKNSKVEKNSFGKAILTYPVSTGGAMSSILTYGGILIALAGVVLFIRNRMKPNIKLVVNTNKAQQQEAPPKETTSVTNITNQVSNN
jgi:LPXTG-motif cell wall-anchored protein